jgi:uncharacterized Zn-binding protein involved in type VI secretion
MKTISLLGDKSDHGGTIVESGQGDNKFIVNGIPVAVEGALHSCPILWPTPHGTTPIKAITIKSVKNGKLIVTQGAKAECGAIILPVPGRNVFVE